MIWRFSDGTIAHLGGEIEGVSLFAQELREVLLQPDQPIAIWPHPSPAVALDVNDAAIFDRYLYAEMMAPFRKALKLTMTERPSSVPELPPPPWGDGPTDDDAVF